MHTVFSLLYLQYKHLLLANSQKHFQLSDWLTTLDLSYTQGLFTAFLKYRGDDNNGSRHPQSTFCSIQSIISFTKSWIYVFSLEMYWYASHTHQLCTTKPEVFGFFLKKVILACNNIFLPERPPDRCVYCRFIFSSKNSAVLILTMHGQLKITAVKLVPGWHFTSISSCKISFGCNDVHLEGIHLWNDSERVYSLIT